MEIGQRLRELREQRDLTGRAAATYLGISSAHVSDMENDKARPSLDLLARLAKYYRTTTDYLLGITDDPDPARAENKAQEAALLAQLPGPERAIVRALLLLLAQETPEERHFTLEVIERLLLPAQPRIIGEEPDEPAAKPDPDTASPQNPPTGLAPLAEPD
jgi:transcriptional regulator with XRE-family HTH domain